MRLMAIITSAFIAFNTCFALDTKADMFDIGSPTPLAARLRQLTNGITANPTFTSVHVTGGVTANDFATRQGAGGPASGNGFNIGWGTGCATLWIDTTNLGCISLGSTTGPSYFPGGILSGKSATDNYINTWAYGYTNNGLVAISPDSQVGAVFASRTSDGGPGAGAIGSVTWAFNDHQISAGGASFAWAGYAECRRYSGAGGCLAREDEVTNFGDTIDFNTYIGSVGSGPYATFVYFLGSGGQCYPSAQGGVPCYNPATGNNDLNANPATGAINILNNGAPFMNGITFAWNALYGNTDDSGSVGNGVAIKMPAGDYIKWDKCPNTAAFPANCGNNNGASLGSVITNGDPLAFQFTNSGFLFINSSASCYLSPTTGGMSTSCSSDERLKEDIKLYSDDALAFIDSFVIHDYKIKATGERAIGPIAQELQKSQPDLVHEGADGILTVEQPNLWKLVAAIQELNACQKSFMCRLYGR